jgi:hypothetical protein
MYEYKVIPAPRKAQRTKGAKGTTERFAIGLQATLNELGASGWSFVRSETLPVDERHGLLRKAVEEFHTVLIFRRPLTARAATEEASGQHRLKFFAEKAPAPAKTSAPALGAANDAEVIATPEIRAEKEPKAQPEEKEPEDKPATKPAAKKAKKPSASKAKE